MLTSHHGPNDPDDHDHDEHVRFYLRLGVAGLVLLAAVAAACVVMVPAGTAAVITRFGNPNRVVT